MSGSDVDGSSRAAPSRRDLRATGRCLCGAVTYAVRGPLRDILICHCDDCRRWHGYACAMTATAGSDLEIDDSGALRWYTKPGPVPLPQRGLCARCGSSLFWRAPERPTVSIAAGTLDGHTGLRVVAHIFTSHMSDWDVVDDGLPRFEGEAPPSLSAVPRDPEGA